MTNGTTNSPTSLGQTVAPSVAPATVRQFGIVENTETLIIAVLVGVICCLLTLLIAVVMPYLFPVSEDTVPEDSESADPEKVKRRYQTIEDWLVTKEIRERERDENHVYQNVSSVNTGSLARNDQKDSGEEEAKHNDEEAPSTTDCGGIHSGVTSCAAAAKQQGGHENHEEIEACQICMEDFKVGDSVSWSTGCDHVYHFTCIQEWLLKKTDCPYCRQTMLQVDATDEYDVVALMSEKQKRANSTFFCLHEGLVVAESLTAHGNEADLADGRLDGLVIESPIAGNLRVAGENDEVAETVDMDLPNDDDSDHENGSHLVVVIEEDVTAMEPAVISESSVLSQTSMLGREDDR